MQRTVREVMSRSGRVIAGTNIRNTKRVRGVMMNGVYRTLEELLRRPSQ